MPSSWSVKPPPPVIAAFALVMLFVVGSIGTAIVLVLNGYMTGLFVGGFGLLISGFVAYGLWRGGRRGSQILALVFSAFLIGGMCSSPAAGIFTAPIGAAIIFLLTIPRQSWKWFDYRR